MTEALFSYAGVMLMLAFALLTTAASILLVVSIGAILYALYKGATDETWR